MDENYADFVPVLTKTMKKQYKNSESVYYPNGPKKDVKNVV